MCWHQTKLINMLTEMFYTLLHPFLAFGSISNTYIAQNHIAAGPWSRLGWPTQKSPAFTQTLSHKEFGFSFQNPKLHKLNLGPHFRLYTTAKFG